MDFSNILDKKRRRAIANAILTPFSWIYGAVVWVRNQAFDRGWIRSESFDVPVVSVGNITVGGTGKTPHVEYIIEHLCSRYNIGVISRGYKRDSKGFVLATDYLSVNDIGDEPYQIYSKFKGRIMLAVCEDRPRGIKNLLKINPNINLILLDDAFQHRYVKPKVNIVLVDYNRPPYNDKLMPLGNLREPAYRILKSDIVVVTKCPTDITPIKIRMLIKNLELFPAQQLYFSNIKYAAPKPVFPISNPELSNLSWLQPDDLILGITGIAHSRNFVLYLKQFGTRMKLIHFNDHHKYTRDDFRFIFRVFRRLQGRRKFILTTEKDAVRILNNPYFPPTMQSCIYYIPIKVGFLDYEDRDFPEELIAKIEE